MNNNLIKIYINMKAMLKSELARCAGVSLETMRKYINNVKCQFPDAYKSSNKMLSPIQVKIMCDFYCIDIK